MSSSSQNLSFKRNKRNKYQKINQKLRQQVIQRLCVRKEGLRQVASLLNINHSTCKAIVKVYEKEGRIGKKKTRNRNVDIIQTFTFCIIDNRKCQELPEIKVYQSKISCERNEDINEILIKRAKEKGEQLAHSIVEARKKVNQLLQNQIQSASRSLNYMPIFMNNNINGYMNNGMNYY